MGFENITPVQGTTRPDVPVFVRLPPIRALAELKKFPQWVSWGYKLVEQPVPAGAAPLAPRYSKPPINPATGVYASVADRRTWSTYEDAEAYSLKHGLPGVGFMLAPENEIIGFDLDDCLDLNGKPEPWVEQILALKETYAEVSPSGRGVRILARGKLDKAIKSDAAQVEIYGADRYLTITGNKCIMSPDEIRPAPMTFAALRARVESVAGHRRSAGHRPTNLKKVVTAGTDFYRNVNDAALADLTCWVPELLPEARFVSAPQGYRITSVDLGRELEEDLCIHPTGIVDFGTADQDDTRDGTRSPIDLVIEYADAIDLGLVQATADTERKQNLANSQNAVKAASWLCEQMGVSPWDLGKKPISLDDWVNHLNSRYCTVQDGGKTWVLSFEKDPSLFSHSERPRFQSFQAFRDHFNNQLVEVPGKKEGETDTKAVGTMWLTHPQRRTYEGVVFDPDKPCVIGSHLNLWRGFAVEPVKGDWSLMQRHIREVLADSNDEYADYILKWLAYLIQSPGKPAEVAIVLKGKKGTGKGTLGNALCQIFGEHGRHIFQASHLVGNFNAHLRSACFLFADEAYLPGDKSAESTLKAYITEPTLAIEAKGKDVTQSKNCLTVFVASNEEWVIPAREDERRFAVFDVSSSQMQNHDWFDPLHKQMGNGGYEAMLYDLQRLEIGDWHPRKNVPHTKALLQQQEAGLSPLDAWWKSVLDAGVLPKSFEACPNLSHSETLFKDIRRSSPNLRYSNDQNLASFLKASCGAVSGKKFGRRGYMFPPLAEARTRWERRFPGTVWDETGMEDWTYEQFDMEGYVQEMTTPKK